MPTEVVSRAEARAVQQFELLLQSAASAEAAEQTDARSGSRKRSTSGRASTSQTVATGKAYRALLSLVESQCADPQLLQCGLEKARAADGTVEWVTEASKARFDPNPTPTPTPTPTPPPTPNPNPSPNPNPNPNQGAL